MYTLFLIKTANSLISEYMGTDNPGNKKKLFQMKQLFFDLNFQLIYY